MPNPARYRQIVYVGERILQAAELNRQQAIERGVDDNEQPSSFDLAGAMFPQGATFNIDFTPSIGGGNAPIAVVLPIDSQRPMMVFVRDRWEILQPSEIHVTMVVDATQKLYLNWSLNHITSAQDGTLKDATTGEDTAEMAELVLSVDTADTSGVALNPTTQLAKNTAPIPLCTYAATPGRGAGFAGIPTAPFSFAMASKDRAGLVKLSTPTSSVAVADDDPRLNTLGTPSAPTPALTVVKDQNVYNPANGGDSNGISAAKIRISRDATLLTDALDELKAQIAAIEAAIAALGQPTGGGPTQDLTGHIGQPIGSKTHPPHLASDSDMFRVTRSVAATGLDAFQVIADGQITGGIGDDGDFHGEKLASYSVPPATGRLVTGSLEKLSKFAAAFIEHIGNPTAHNPTLDGLGGVTAAYVDSHDASVLDAAKAYAAAYVDGHKTSAAVSASGSWVTLPITMPDSSVKGIAIGCGQAMGGTALTAPAGYTIAAVMTSFAGHDLHNGTIAAVSTSWDGSAVQGTATLYNGSGARTGIYTVNVGWVAIAVKS